jgi:hypothetical protein
VAKNTLSGQLHTLGGGITESGQQETKNTLSQGIDVSRNVVTLVRVATEAKTHSMAGQLQKEKHNIRVDKKKHTQLHLM